jgi:oligopeptide transport system ATP-binding protein
MTNGQPLLEVRNLTKNFPVRSSLFSSKTEVRAVDRVSFQIMPQESLAVVGESGCGKTTLGKLILALERPSSGQVFFNGHDMTMLSSSALRHLRSDIQVIFQDPYSSLNPRMTVEEIITEPWIIHGRHKNPEEREKKLSKLLDDCGISQTYRSRHPHEFSGGQRQRVGIARALALDPKLIIADEPVSALDVSVQAQILNLLKDLQQERRLAYLFISHDFSVVRHLCHRIAVMYLGRIVEMANCETLLRDPQHPYTEALLSAIPIPDPIAAQKRKRILLTGDIPSPLSPPSGCHFHPRCRYSVDSCRSLDPLLTEAAPHHFAACPIQPFQHQPSASALIK